MDLLCGRLPVLQDRNGGDGGIFDCGINQKSTISGYIELLAVRVRIAHRPKIELMQPRHMNLRFRKADTSSVDNRNDPVLSRQWAKRLRQYVAIPRGSSVLME